MTIDPRWNFWLSVSLAILAFLSGAGSNFADIGLPPSAVRGLMGLAGILLGIGNAFNAVLAAIPSKSDPNSINKFYLGPKTEVPPKP